MNKCYSIDDENYNIKDFDELLDELRYKHKTESVIGLTYWKADAIPITAGEHIDVEWFLEECNARAYDDIGDVYKDDFLDASKDATEELRTMLVEWVNKHIDLNYWRVANSVEMKVTADDLGSQNL